jgi:prolyl 4-hydroxylase
MMPNDQNLTTVRAEYQQGARLFALGQHPEALPYVSRAAEGGDAEAQNLLGLMYLNGLGVQIDARQAAEYFEASAAQGLKEACYSLANLLFNGIGIPRNGQRAQSLLLASARANHRAAFRSLGYLYHLMGDNGTWPRLSTACFQRAADLGDAHAQYALGVRFWEGLGVEKNPSAAYHWWRTAAKSGIYLAAARLAVAADTTPAVDAVPRQVDLPEPLFCELPKLDLPKPSSEKVFMAEFEHYIDPFLCDHIVNLSAPYVTPSLVADPALGTPERSVLRTSDSTYLRLSMYDVVVAQIWHRMATLAGLPPERSEPLEVLRYTVGQEYRQHCDFFTDGKHEARRLVTAFVYLSDVPEGGATAFPKLGVEVQPQRGKAVRFYNYLPDGRPNTDTLHAGREVLRGEKWLGNFWFWDRPFLWFQ